MASNAQIDGLRVVLRWLRHEPLVLFMVLGLGLFLIHSLISDSRDDTDSHLIRVDRKALLGYAQSRARSADDMAVVQLDAMPAAELTRLVDDYVRDEAMYREALALGLERDDPLIRLRLIQSLQFMFRNLGEAGNPAEADLRNYYAANLSRYATPANITFSHVFFDEAVRGRSGAEQIALQTMSALNAKAGALDPADDWPGDRFAYNLAYAERDEATIASHFGPDMARRLFAAKADDSSWQGPFQSTSGYHLVRVERLEAGQTVPFGLAKGAVVRDYLVWRGDQAEEVAADALVKQFDVSLSADVRTLIESRTQSK